MHCLPACPDDAGTETERAVAGGRTRGNGSDRPGYAILAP
jgi:hypothetical protein